MTYHEPGPDDAEVYAAVAVAQVDAMPDAYRSRPVSDTGRPGGTAKADDRTMDRPTQ